MEKRYTGEPLPEIKQFITTHQENYGLDIHHKAVKYGTTDLQQIEAIDRLLAEARKEEREKLIERVKSVFSPEKEMSREKAELYDLLTKLNQNE